MTHFRSMDGSWNPAVNMLFNIRPFETAKGNDLGCYECVWKLADAKSRWYLYAARASREIDRSPILISHHVDEAAAVKALVEFMDPNADVEGRI